MYRECTFVLNNLKTKIMKAKKTNKKISLNKETLSLLSFTIGGARKAGGDTVECISWISFCPPCGSNITCVG